MEYIVRFENVSSKDANILALDLKRAVLDSHPDVSAESRRERSDTQDLGSLLAIILGAEAVVAVAKGIETWLARNQSASIRIERPDGSVVVTGITSRNAFELAQILGQTDSKGS